MTRAFGASGASARKYVNEAPAVLFLHHHGKPMRRNAGAGSSGPPHAGDAECRRRARISAHATFRGACPPTFRLPCAAAVRVERVRIVPAGEGGHLRRVPCATARHRAPVRPAVNPAKAEDQVDGGSRSASGNPPDRPRTVRAVPRAPVRRGGAARSCAGHPTGAAQPGP